jgi:hypothetical protein
MVHEVSFMDENEKRTSHFYPCISIVSMTLRHLFCVFAFVHPWSWWVRVQYVSVLAHTIVVAA